jgi:hypothetical protein
MASMSSVAFGASVVSASSQSTNAARNTFTGPEVLCAFRQASKAQLAHVGREIDPTAIESVKFLGN